MRRVLCRVGLHRWRRNGPGEGSGPGETHLSCSRCGEDRYQQEASVAGWRIHSNPPGTGA